MSDSSAAPSSRPEPSAIRREPPFVCPRCGGNRVINMGNSPLTAPCSVCNGEGLVWPPPKCYYPAQCDTPPERQPCPTCALVRSAMRPEWPYLACEHCGSIERIPTEADRHTIYADCIARGLSDSEARGTGWPEPPEVAAAPPAPEGQR